MTARFLVASAYVAGALVICFYVIVAFIWLGTAIVADVREGRVYKSLNTPIDDCRDFKCVKIVR